MIATSRGVKDVSCSAKVYGRPALNGVCSCGCVASVV